MTLEKAAGFVGKKTENGLIVSRRFMKWNATIIVTLFFLSTRTDQNSS